MSNWKKPTPEQEEILKRHLPDYWKGQIGTGNPLIASIIKAMNEVQSTPVEKVVIRTVYRNVTLPSIDDVARAACETEAHFRNANENVHHMIGFVAGGKWVISELEELLKEKEETV